MKDFTNNELRVGDKVVFFDIASMQLRKAKITAIGYETVLCLYRSDNYPDMVYEQALRPNFLVQISNFEVKI